MEMCQLEMSKLSESKIISLQTLYKGSLKPLLHWKHEIIRSCPKQTTHSIKCSLKTSDSLNHPTQVKQFHS